MKICIIICCIIVSVLSKDEAWIWNDKKNLQRSRSEDFGNPRYEIHENTDDYENFDTGGPFVGFRPQHIGSRPQQYPNSYGHGNRPFVTTYPNNNGVLVGPGGPTGIIGRPHAPSGGSIIDYDDNLDSGHVPFPNPKGSRYREYDICKCRYSFNCPSVGLKFGNCANGKRYCCFNSKSYPSLVSIDPRDRN
ncbi:PREDICTED: uncharacterized protein LOC107071151 [Polistes dominula]|uniref:Uncharacterized protein LOC107071151 n=1 Tax=Polistes dominula TaxID=743375 RepID=A0ABM1IYT6_POLDO|nr:PREDICTED: uncharacterized protein LOC107071151 [Polistes dominula]